jgi:hypothetical protein
MKTKNIIAIILTMLIITSCSQPEEEVVIPDSWDIEHYNSGDSGELVDFIPAIDSNDPDFIQYDYSVLYRIEVPNLRAGDVVVATVEHAVINALPHLISVGGQVLLCDNPTDDTYDDGILEISEVNNTYIPDNADAQTLTHLGSITITQDYSSRYINYVIEAHSSSSTTGEIITIPQDYGRLSVIVYKAPQ